MRRFLDGLDHTFHLRVLNDDLDFHLRQKVDDIFRTSIKLSMAFLPAKPLASTTVRAFDAGFRQCVFHIIKFERLDHRLNLFHQPALASILVQRAFPGGVRILLIARLMPCRLSLGEPCILTSFRGRRKTQAPLCLILGIIAQILIIRAFEQFLHPAHSILNLLRTCGIAEPDKAFAKCAKASASDNGTPACSSNCVCSAFASIPVPVMLGNA